MVRWSAGGKVIIGGFECLGANLERRALYTGVGEAAAMYDSRRRAEKVRSKSSLASGMLGVDALRAR